MKLGEKETEIATNETIYQLANGRLRQYLRMEMRKYKYIAAIMLTTTLVTIVLVLLILHFDRNAAVDSGPKMIIDHDGGADDAMAIFMALLYEKYFDGPKVIALTTNHGNVYEEQAFINTEKILNIAQRRHVPIYRGSAYSLISNHPSDYYFGHDGLGDNEQIEYEYIKAQAEPAAVALIELSKKYNRNLVVVTLGSLTNIALAIRLDPDFLSRLSHLYVAAGHIYSELYPNPEFNALMDVESYYIVMENASPNNVTVIPYSQIKMSLNISREWRKEVLGSIPTKIMSAQNEYERLSIRSEKWALLDPSAMAVVLNNNIIVEQYHSNNSIILCGSERGININIFTSNKPNVNLIYRINEDTYKNMLIDIFSAEL